MRRLEDGERGGDNVGEEGVNGGGVRLLQLVVATEREGLTLKRQPSKLIIAIQTLHIATLIASKFLHSHPKFCT